MATEPLATLLRRLREERGLRQRELADRAGYGVEVVAKIEQGRGVVRSLTARALFRALGAISPLREREAHDFLSQCGLISANATRSLPPREMHDFVTDGLVVITPEPPATFADLADHETPTPPVARAARELELAAGMERTLLLLRHILALLPPPSTAPATPERPTPMLVKPPVIKEGVTIQEFAPVRPPPALTPPARTRKAR